MNNNATEHTGEPDKDPVLGPPQITPLSVGTTVKVNCYLGTIRRVVTSLERKDPFTSERANLRLIFPLYDVELDFSTKHPWNERRVHIPEGKTKMLLFSDEFVVMDKDRRLAS